MKNKPVFLWNLVDLKRVRWQGPELTPGKHVLEFDFKALAGGRGAADARAAKQPGERVGRTSVDSLSVFSRRRLTWIVDALSLLPL